MTMDFSTFCKYASSIEDVASNTETIELTADLFTEAEDDLGVASRFIQGRIFPAWKDTKVEVGPATMYAAISKASGRTEDEVESLVADVGGVGEACEELSFQNDSGQQKLTNLGGSESSLSLSEVYETLEDLAAVSGSGSQTEKEKTLSNVLLDCESSNEAKYFARLVLGEMRIGVGSGTVRDALALSFNIDSKVIERGLMVTNDVGLVAETARDGGESALSNLEIELFRPVSPMLAQKGVKSDALDDAGHGGEVVVEYKFDGSRLQIHKNGDEVKLFTRRMNEVTDSMPDVVDIVREDIQAETAILDAEVVAYESEDATEPEPFQQVMRRLRRKYDIDEMAEEIILDIHTFDILYVNGDSLIDESLAARREHLVDVCGDTLSEQWYADSAEEIADLEANSLAEGHEGVMVKDPSSTYHPNNRGKNWLKIKPDVETLDCVVVGGEWGEGRREGWIGSFMLAVRDEETGDLRTIGKVATGLTDKELEQLTERFEPLIESEEGKEITFSPETVFEVGYEEIQPSPTYTSGYGLRFPRFLGVREDKSIDNADTVSRVADLA